MTTGEYLDLVLFRLHKGNVPPNVDDIAAAVESQRDTVLGRLGDLTAMSEHGPTRALFQKTWTGLTLSGGDVAVPSDAVIQALPRAVLTLTPLTADPIEPLEYVDDLYDLLNPLPISDYINYSVNERKIKVRKYDPETGRAGTPLETALSVTGNYTPTLSDVVLGSDAAEILVNLAVSLYAENPVTAEERADEE